MITPYLAIRNIRIQNANAMSSPVTIGFPAMTAWLGGMHALERRLRQREELSELHFTRLAVSCQAFDLQTYRGVGDYVDSVIITANPLQKKGKSFDRPSFIEEARVHLTVSLLFALARGDRNLQEPLIKAIAEELPRMKLASGDILSFQPPKEILYQDDEEPTSDKAILRKLTPGYVLIERRDLLKERMEAGENSVDALLHFLEIQYQAEKNEDGEVTGWKGKKAEPGWIVPLATGFKGLSPLGRVRFQRDAETPHRFAESVITLGEFKMAHHFQHVSEILWEYKYLADENLYLCTNQ